MPGGVSTTRPVAAALAALATLACAVVVVAAAGAATSATSARSVQVVKTPLLRTKGGAVFCGLKPSGGRDLLVCWVPKTGYTIRLSPRGGIPKGNVVKKNRGRPPRPTAFRLLGAGKKLDRGPFHCRGMSHAEVRCSNGAQHGFQLGAKGSFLL